MSLISESNTAPLYCVLIQYIFVDEVPVVS